MLSVFITPWTKPIRIQSTIISAVNRTTSANQSVITSSGCSPLPSARSGKSVRIVQSTSRRNSSNSPRVRKSSKLPKRTNDGLTRHTTAPSSGAGLPS